MAREKIQERMAAEQFFIDMFWDAKTIADHLDLEPMTVSKWRKKYDWDKKREETINNPLKMKRLISQQMMLVAQGEKATIDADALAKMYKVYEGLSDKLNPGIVAGALELLDNWLAKENPELAVANLPYHKKFLQHIVITNG